MKQSLPWLPKGSEFEIKFDDNGKPYMQRENSKLLAECYKTTINYFFIGDFDEFCPDNIIDSGWIEEVKPREWFVGITDKNIPCYIGDDKPDAKLNQQNGFLFMGENISTIKVREVLE